MAEGSWGEQQRISLIIGLVVSLRKAHDASPTTSADPTLSRTSLPRRRPATGNIGAQELDGVPPTMTMGPAAAHVALKTVTPLDAMGLAVRGTKGRGARARATSATGTGARSRGDAYRVSSSTDASRRVTVPEITGISCKKQVVPSLTGVASSPELLGRLLMPDDCAMPVSSNLPTPEHRRSTPPPQAPRRNSPPKLSGRTNTSVSTTSPAFLSFISPPRSTFGRRATTRSFGQVPRV